MVDFSNFNNVTPFVLNESLIGNSTAVLNNVATNADTFTNGWFGLVVIFVTYIFLMWIFTRDDELFRLDFVRASLVASFFAMGLGIILIVSGLISDFRHVMWMGLVFLFSIIGTWNQKKKGL